MSGVSYMHCMQVMTDEEVEEEEEVESIMMDPTHEWWNLWALFRRVFRSHRFKVKSTRILCNSYKIYLASCFAVFETLVRNVRLRNTIVALRILLSI